MPSWCSKASSRRRSNAASSRCTYQPQVRARDGVLVGAEALIRWNHPERGLLLADAFIPVAEKRQLMIGIGQWVLHEATRCALRWRDMGLVVAPVAVNLSNVQFQASGFSIRSSRNCPAGPSTAACSNSSSPSAC